VLSFILADDMLHRNRKCLLSFKRAAESRRYRCLRGSYSILICIVRPIELAVKRVLLKHTNTYRRCIHCAVCNVYVFYIINDWVYITRRDFIIFVCSVAMYVCAQTFDDKFLWPETITYFKFKRKRYYIVYQSVTYFALW